MLQGRSMFDTLPDALENTIETSQARDRIRSTMGAWTSTGASGVTRARKDIEGVLFSRVLAVA